jgi:protein-tyrosine phosphatase
MAEAMFNALAEDRGLRWRARSVGVAALKGASVAPNACAALEEVGIYSEGHRARQVSEEMLKDADLVLAMTPQLVTELRRRFEGLSENCYTLQEYATEVSNQEGIPDPYGLHHARLPGHSTSAP